MPPAAPANSVATLLANNTILKDQLKKSDAAVTTLTEELRVARTLLHSLTKELHAAKAKVEEMEMEVDEDEEDDDELPEVLTTDVYLCSVCAYEVVDGYCQGLGCGLQHVWPPTESLHDNYSISTNNHALHPDRSIICRDNTPLRDLDEHDSLPPAEYRWERHDEYEELLRRGATRLMCETFHLEFSEDNGIYAWADWEIYNQFSGPLMRHGDYWKIHLGRRIQLDEDDLDGSMFIEDLLEDAVRYPVRSKTCKRTYDKWETIEETPGIWRTRLVVQKADTSDGEDILSGDDSSDEDGLSHSSSSDEDRELENPSGPGVYSLDSYSTGDDSDPEDDEMSEDDDFGSPNEARSDSEDTEVDDTAFVDLIGPDRVWGSDMDDSEDDEYELEDEADDDQLKDEA